MSHLAKNGEAIMQDTATVYALVAKIERGEVVPHAFVDLLLEKLGDLDMRIQRLVSESLGIEKEHSDLLLTTKTFCVGCWTSAYAPCEESFDDAIPDGKGGWMYCQMCLAEDRIRELMATNTLLP